MSRIILSRYDDGSEHVVVGYDRALQTYYWQEFNITLSTDEWDELTEEEADNWDNMIGYAGYNPHELPEVRDLFNHAAAHNNVVMLTMMAVIERDIFRGVELMPELKRHKTLDSPESNLILDLSMEQT